MRKSLFTFFLFVIVCPAAAQIKILRNIGSDEGLCQSHVFSICEDRRGFLWIGTYNGISRWDGKRFLTFDKSDGLAGNQVSAIYEGLDSTMYFGTDEGLSWYKNGLLSSAPLKVGHTGERIQAVYQTTDGALFVGTARRGILIYHKGRVDTLNLRSGLPSNAITSFAGTADSALVIGTKNGICFYKGGRLTCPEELSGMTITHICPLAKGGFAFTSLQRGVQIWRDQMVSSLPFNEELIKARVYAVAEDSNGTLFCATFGKGVLVLEDGRLQRLTEENGLAHNNVFAILCGHSGSLYFGTVAGLSIYRHGVLSVYDEEIGIARKFVISISEGGDGAFYFGTFGGGITRLREGRYDQLNRKNGLAGDMVYCVREIDGALYCGTTEGLSLLQDGRFTTIKSADDGQSLRIRAIMPTRSGEIMLAGAAGLHRLRAGRADLISSMHDRSVFSMCEGPSGEFYLATDKGAYRYNNLTLDSIAVVPKTMVFAARALRDGRICFGTDLGLYIVKDESSQVLAVKDGLLHNSVVDVLEDAAGRIYLLTMRGVNILDFSSAQLRIRSLQNSDGLASDECSANSGWVDRKGRIWIGSIRGATCYDPAHDRPDALPPKMHIERMRLFDQDIPIQRQTAPVFANDQNYFKFDFVGINLQAPDKVRYRYQLQGVDAAWVDTRETFVQYTSLDDGEYRFDVKACNDWGVWSEPASVRFVIRPAFWETWWFLSLVSVLAAGAAALVITRRVRYLLSIERLRMRIAADLHDQIGSGLTEISILSEVARQKHEKAMPQVVPTLNKISEISRTLVDNMSDIVWLVNPKRDSLYDLLIRLKDAYDEVLTSSGISLQTQNLQQLHELRLPMDYRQNLYMILKEALNNSLKHSHCRQISLTADIQHRHLHLCLEDDGDGFDARRDGRGNGLVNMKRRAQALGGALIVESAVGAGTRICFDGRI